MVAYLGQRELGDLEKKMGKVLDLGLDQEDLYVNGGGSFEEKGRDMLLDKGIGLKKIKKSKKRNQILSYHIFLFQPFLFFYFFGEGKIRKKKKKTTSK